VNQQTHTIEENANIAKCILASCTKDQTVYLSLVDKLRLSPQLYS